jgi:hypothetical protein
MIDNRKLRGIRHVRASVTPQQVASIAAKTQVTGRRRQVTAEATQTPLKRGKIVYYSVQFEKIAFSCTSPQAREKRGTSPVRIVAALVFHSATKPNTNFAAGADIRRCGSDGLNRFGPSSRRDTRLLLESVTRLVRIHYTCRRFASLTAKGWRQRDPSLRSGFRLRTPAFSLHGIAHTRKAAQVVKDLVPLLLAPGGTAIGCYFIRHFQHCLSDYKSQAMPSLRYRYGVVTTALRRRYGTVH